MMSFANQTVQDFFQEANWQGLKLIQNDQETNTISSNLREISVDCHLGLTVEEYFSLNNWHGIATKEIYHEQNSQVSESEPVFSLTISVAEFFQRMVWQKQTKQVLNKIATPPSNATPKASSSKANKQFNFQDLSDLM